MISQKQWTTVGGWTLEAAETVSKGLKLGWTGLDCWRRQKQWANRQRLEAEGGYDVFNRLKLEAAVGGGLAEREVERRRDLKTEKKFDSKIRAG